MSPSASKSSRLREFFDKYQTPLLALFILAVLLGFFFIVFLLPWAIAGE